MGPAAAAAAADNPYHGTGGKGDCDYVITFHYRTLGFLIGSAAAAAASDVGLGLLLAVAAAVINFFVVCSRR